ncbi:TPA: pirin family protein [Klebsiella pneumoniae]|nr:pirin family protein [Klebsiella pneumoniae]
MTVRFSKVVNAAQAAHGAHFAARRLDLQGLGAFALPVMGFDHYRMRGPTFAPHPHAGFSTISYIFENSIGGLRNRDSLQNDLVIEPGAIVWTQAGTGVVHDEFPAQIGREVHGVQIFVNQARSAKALAPRMMHAAAADVPVVMDTGKNRTRVLSGRFSGARSSLDPAEAFDLFDVQATGTWIYAVPPRRNVLVYLLSGSVEIAADDEIRRLAPFQAVAAHMVKAGQLQMTALEPAQFLVLSGTDPGEPVAVHGPFIMNDQAQLAEAFERYTNGEMGRLMPLDIVRQ